MPVVRECFRPKVSNFAVRSVWFMTIISLVSRMGLLRLIVVVPTNEGTVGATSR